MTEVHARHILLKPVAVMTERTKGPRETGTDCRYQSGKTTFAAAKEFSPGSGSANGR